MNRVHSAGMVEDTMLSRHLLFESKDLDETQQCVSKVFCDHRLNIEGSRQKFHAQMYHARIGGISFNRLQYGAGVSVDPGSLDKFYLVQMPTHEGEQVVVGSQTVDSGPGCASVVSPTQPMRKRIRANTRKLVVQIDRELLARLCAQYLGYELERPLEFAPSMQLTSGAGSEWWQLVAFFFRQLSNEQSLFQQPLLRTQVEHLIATTLLFGQQNNHLEALLKPERVITPRYVRKAEEFILANADHSITIADIAQHVGVSARSLFDGFRKYRHTSPKALLSKVRLDRARNELLTAGERRETVTQVALRCGFLHLGRFTAEYRKQYGELPSETLRRG